MGEIADMMVDGFLCAMCGVALDGDEPGYARYCSEECAEGIEEAEIVSEGN